MGGLPTFSIHPVDLTSPSCHSRHLRPDCPSCPSPAQASNADGLGPVSRFPALAGSLASTAPGPDGDVGFGPRTSDPGSNIDVPSCLGGGGAAVARVFALPSSSRRPSASSVAAGTSCAVTGVLRGPRRKHQVWCQAQAVAAQGGRGDSRDLALTPDEPLGHVSVSVTVGAIFSYSWSALDRLVIA